WLPALPAGPRWAPPHSASHPAPRAAARPDDWFLPRPDRAPALPPASIPAASGFVRAGADHPPGREIGTPAHRVAWPAAAGLAARTSKPAAFAVRPWPPGRPRPPTAADDPFHPSDQQRGRRRPRGNRPA